MRGSRKARKFAALGLTSALMLAACGGDDDGGGNDDAGDDTEATTEESEATTEESMAEGDGEEAATEDTEAETGESTEESMAEEGDGEEGAEATGDEVVIPVWIAFEDDRLDWTKQVAENFNSTAEGYRVEVTGYDSYDTLFDAAVQAIGSDSQPAVVHFFEAATQEARDAVTPDGDPVFANLEEIIAGREEVGGVPIVLNDVVSAAGNYYKLDGKYSSMPWNTSSSIMFINRSLLDAAGVEGTPANWAELEAACDTFMASDAATDACVTWPNHSWFFEQEVALQNAELANNANGRDARATEVFINSDAMMNWVNWWKGMADKGHYLYTGEQRDWSGTSDLFTTQKVPFLFYSSSDTTNLTTAGTDGGFDVEAAFLPGNGDVSDGGALIGGATNWITAGLDETAQDGAIAWVNFLSNPDNSADWHKTTGYIPITNEAVAKLEADNWYAENPNQKVASDQLAASPDTPATTGALIGNFVAIRDVITQAMEDVLNGADPTETFDKAQSDSQSQLDDYNALFAEG